MDSQQHSETLIPASKVCARYSRSDKTLDRWLKDESLGFPRPVVIRNRRYFREGELVQWERAQAGKQKHAAVTEAA
jgi:predicted DNA-binding transcriptional regulator AlpA